MKPRLALPTATVLATACALALPLADTALAAPPPNDAFASAAVLTGESASADGTTAEATLEPGEPDHSAGDGSVWYSWTAPKNMKARLDTCGTIDAMLVEVYTGSAIDSLTTVPRDEAFCPDTSGNGVVEFQATKGTTYRVSVIEYSTDGPFTLHLGGVSRPANDDFATPRVISGRSADIPATTAGATREAGEATEPSGGSVWFAWTAPTSGRYQFDTCTRQADAAPQVFRGGSIDSLDYADDDVVYSPPGCQAFIQFRARAGTRYRISVASDRQEGTFTLRLREVVRDGGLTQRASRKRIRKNRTVTYRVVLRNLGTVPIDPWVDLLTSRPKKLSRAVPGAKYVRLRTTRGTCKRVTFFTRHPGARCDPGTIPPGAKVVIKAKVRLPRSIRHTVELDYLHGGFRGSNEDDRSSNDSNYVKTKVRTRRR